MQNWLRGMTNISGNDQTRRFLRQAQRVSLIGGVIEYRKTETG